MSHRPNLVVVRAGDNSLHPQWLYTASVDRSWDILVSWFGNGDPDRFRDADILHTDCKGPKWSVVHKILRSNLPWKTDYRYVWIPDDDLECDGRDIDLFFETCGQFDLTLAQPSLSAASFVNHPITVQNPACWLRLSNFVEIMAPCFCVAALESCLHTFANTSSAWGLDYIWPILLGSSAKVAIVDRVAITHTRPGGRGTSYDLIRTQGVDPRREMIELQKRYNCSFPSLKRVIGAVDASGVVVPAATFSVEQHLWLIHP